MDDKKVINIVIVTEQLELIDFVERSLKSSHMISTHQGNQVIDIKKILSHQSIDIIILDDVEGTIGIGSIANAINELDINIPILQLKSSKNNTTFGEFMNNGASLVCPRDDKSAILLNVDLLLQYNENLKKVEKDTNIRDDYSDKFNDLYQGIADPVCYLLDGAFVDCNSAFLRVFEVSDKNELAELTIINFIDKPQQRELKQHLKVSSKRDMSASPIAFKMRTKLGNKLEFIVTSKPAKFNNDDVVQLYLRSTKEGGAGGSSLYDDTTGLANKEQMGFLLKQKKEEFNNRGGIGVIVYILISNYRDIWGSDGIFEAEKFIASIAKFIRDSLPPQTETSRYTDDGILLFIPNIGDNDANKILTKLIHNLDTIIPEGMKRMVAPICYVSFDVFDKDVSYDDLISKLFRASRSASLTGEARLSRPASKEIEKKDNKYLELLKKSLLDGSIKLLYIPIASFKGDGKCRYGETIRLLDEEGNPLVIENFDSIADRYHLSNRFDRWKIETLLNKILELSVSDRDSMKFFISISADSLRDVTFTSWLVEQMHHTGLGGKHFVFEMSVENIQNAYSGAKNFLKIVSENNAEITISGISNLSKENERIINEFRPNFIKIDIREIDTLDSFEEKEVMDDICVKAEEINANIIAGCIESPSQFARIWPYGIALIQGNTVSMPIESMNFNFSGFDLL